MAADRKASPDDRRQDLVKTVIVHAVHHRSGYNARMPALTSLSNQFLIAMPGLADPNFARSVTLLWQHNEEGAVGLVINRLSPLNLAEVLAHLEIRSARQELAQTPVHTGGPVQPECGFVLHEPCGRFDSSLQISPELCITTSRDILTTIASGSGPRRAFLALGYAGWGAGQLEQEIKHNAWLHAPADPRVIFDLPVEQRWEAAASLAGIDVRMLTDYAGHA